jgi:hypothetical protein
MTEQIPVIVYLTWSLEDLDWLHREAGQWTKWSASPRRAQLASEPQPPPPPDPAVVETEQQVTEEASHG